MDTSPDRPPWHIKGDERAEERHNVLCATLEAVYARSHLLIPFKSGLRNLAVGRSGVCSILSLSRRRRDRQKKLPRRR